MTYRLTPKAKHGLQGIVLAIEQKFGARVADRVLARIVGAFERLAEYPESGHHREDLTDSSAIRFWSVGPTLLAYRVGAEGIEVLLVARGEVDWEKLLEGS